jgi:dolichol-phosphate mannosyltransferase
MLNCVQERITKKNIGIVIPAFNEENNIERLVKKIKGKFRDSLIIIVDDSRHKKTWKLIKKKKLKVNYAFRGKKLGRGSAVIFGLKKLMKNKKIKIFVEMDADFSHNPAELPRNINFFRKNSLDLLIGSRYLKKSKIINWSLKRRVFSILANYLARSLLKIPIYDFTNGYRIYSKRAVKKIIKNCGKIDSGFIVLSEILLELHINNFKIREIESIFVDRKRGESSISLKLILVSLYGLIKLYFNSRKEMNLTYRQKTI